MFDTLTRNNEIKRYQMFTCLISPFLVLIELYLVFNSFHKEQRIRRNHNIFCELFCFKPSLSFQKSAKKRKSESVKVSPLARHGVNKDFITSNTT